MPNIISVNKEHTVNGHQVAFNLDARASEGVVNGFEYGVLSIWEEGRILHVKAPDDGPEIDGSTVANLNRKLAEGEAAYEDGVRRRNQRLARLAANLGLPTD